MRTENETKDTKTMNYARFEVSDLTKVKDKLGRYADLIGPRASTTDAHSKLSENVRYDEDCKFGTYELKVTTQFTTAIETKTVTIRVEESYAREAPFTDALKITFTLTDQTRYKRSDDDYYGSKTDTFDEFYVQAKSTEVWQNFPCIQAIHQELVNEFTNLLCPRYIR